jgi:hypothetical protein
MGQRVLLTAANPHRTESHFHWERKPGGPFRSSGLFWPIYHVKEAKYLAAIFEAASKRMNPDARVTHAQLGPTWNASPV